MKIFISWSGERSKALATALSIWLPKVLQGARPWMSDQSIAPGASWYVELEQALEECEYAIICVTPENLNAPWLLFEAGALSRAYKKSKTVPLCCGVAVNDVAGPLAQLQGVSADEVGMRRLVFGLNEAMGSPVPHESLRETFDVWWPSLNGGLQKIETEPSASGASAVRVRRVLFAVTEDYDPPEMLADVDQAILQKHFPGQVVVQRPTSLSMLSEALTSSRFDIVHLLALVEPMSGKTLLGHGESIKAEGLRKLLEASQTKFAFLATCDSLVLASEIVRSMSVVAAFGTVNAEFITAWQRTFYGLLAVGRPLSEAYEIAKSSSDQPIVLLTRHDTRFIVEGRSGAH